MTTETLTPAAETSSVEPMAPATATARTNTFSVLALVLSIVSIVFAMSPVAIVGIVLGFIGHRDEPHARTMSIWAIVLGFVSLFGWIILGLLALSFALPFAYGAWAFGWF